ncbi:MAG: 50S ribosome-binding GTPase, partial [Proteobacteria bacterium]|nr:50S ribosome-binding GTPase [Pseudomonadota bacterium]
KSIVNKLLDTCKPKRIKQLKVVFLGRPGSGKTTAIGNISTSKVLTTEVSATDSVGMLKNQTTIGIDYGEYKFEDKIMLRLYGTPGQKRYDFVRNQIIKNADIYIIMIDLTSSHPFQELNYFNSTINRSGINRGVIKMIALTHADQSKLNVSQLVKQLKDKSHGKFLISVMDPRNQIESKKVLKNVAELILNQDLIEQHINTTPLISVQSMTKH